MRCEALDAGFRSSPSWRIGSGCTMVPRSQVADCQRASQTFAPRTPGSRIKSSSYQTQNRDYADRAVDDSRRLAAQEETIDRLQKTTLAYQNDVSRLEAAFKQLTANLGDFGDAHRARRGSGRVRQVGQSARRTRTKQALVPRTPLIRMEQPGFVN